MADCPAEAIFCGGQVSVGCGEQFVVERPGQCLDGMLANGAWQTRHEVWPKCGGSVSAGRLISGRPSLSDGLVRLVDCHLCRFCLLLCLLALPCQLRLEGKDLGQFSVVVLGPLK